MKKLIGGLLTAGGVFGVIYFSYQYFQESKTFELFGADIAISTGDFKPIIIAAVALAAGVVISKINFR